MSRRLKVTLFVLASNIIGFAEGYLMRILVTALGAVLLSRRFL
jgi:hypothetical protein